jgi:aspartyl-tRNA(Asn)/glutamyl-tRNA(Gln) amidotransferase subunit C
MADSRIDIHYVAHLARLELSEAEEDRMQEQLAAILGYVQQLGRLDLTAVEPMAHAVRLVNVSRADEVRASLPSAEALRNAPAQSAGLFQVPKIVE